MTLHPGQEIGTYRVVQKIGEGGFGAVYTAEDTTIGRQVVLKVLTTDVAGDLDMLKRFQREVEMIARLEHPYILPVYEYGQVDGDPYIAMRFMRGGSLHDALRKKGLSQEQLLGVLEQVAEALDFAHDRDVIHRDLKPANVLLDEGGNAYLADFGLAKTMEGSRDLTATGGLLGTPAYMSPEQVRGEKLDRRSDVYSFAIMVYEALAGENPFRVSNSMDYLLKHMTEPPRPISSLAPGLPPAVDEVFNQALAKDPAGRTARAMEFIANLRSALARESIALPPSTPDAATAPGLAAEEASATVVAPEQRKRRSRSVLWIGAAATGITAGVLLLNGGLAGPEVFTYPVGDSPRALLSDGESVWVANFFDSTLARLTATGCEVEPDACGKAVASYSVPDLPVGLASDGTALWIASALGQSLTRFDPASGEALGRYPLPNVPSALIYADGFLWTANELSGSVTKIDRSGEVVGDYSVGSAPRALLWDGESLWIASEQDGSISRMDAGSGALLDSYPLDGSPPALAFDGEHLWVALSDRGEVLQVDRSDGAVLARIPAGANPLALLFETGTLWVADGQGNAVVAIDVATGEGGAAIPVGDGPYALAWVACGQDCGDLWVVNEAGDSVSRVRNP